MAKYCVLKTGEDAFCCKGEDKNNLVCELHDKGFILVQSEDVVAFNNEEDADEYKNKYNAKSSNRKALRRLLYFKKDDNNHEGFIGEAYYNVINLFDTDSEKAVYIAGTEIEKLSSINRKEDFDFNYEDVDNDNFYTVKFTYAYAQHFNHIYRKLLQNVTEDYVKENGLKIVSVGAGNFVDYWSLESALYMEDWKQDAINKIHYHAYEIENWPVNMRRGIEAERGQGTPYRIPKENIKFSTPNDEDSNKGNFFEITEEVDVVIFPSSFNELIKQQEENIDYNIVNVLKKMKPKYIITTGHMSKEDNEKIENTIKEYCKDIETFDKLLGSQLMQSVMPSWCGDNNITVKIPIDNTDGFKLKIMGLEEIEGIAHFIPMININENVEHRSYKINVDKRGDINGF